MARAVRGFAKKRALHAQGLRLTGGETGIRTLDTFDRIPDFESGAFDHSAISPVSNGFNYISRARAN